MAEFVDFEIEEVESADVYVYDLEMADTTQPWFYANDILLHNSCYISIKSLVDSGVIKEFVDADGNLSSDVYKYSEELTDYLNKNITEWAIKAFNSQDCRLVFKREVISDVSLFLEKKRYAMHILDDEDVKVNKFKYTGVEVVRTTMPDPVKPYVKNIIETMLMKRSQSDTDKAVKEAYDVFISLPVEDISFVVGLSSFDEYVRKCNGFQTCKGMPVHAKAGYYYNNILKDLSIDAEYEPVATGDKIRWMYVQPANKYGVSVIGFKGEMPVEMKDLFKVDYEKMFNKIVFSVVERFYKRVNWVARKPNEQIRCDLFELFS